MSDFDGMSEDFKKEMEKDMQKVMGALHSIIGGDPEQIECVLQELEGSLEKLKSCKTPFVLTCAVKTQDGVRRIAAMAGADPVELLGLLEVNNMHVKEELIQNLNKKTEDRI